MSKPLSFKQILASKKLNFKSSLTSPRVPTLSEEHVEFQKFRKFLDAERCVVCGAQVDGSIVMPKCRQTCVQSRHYTVEYMFEVEHPLWYHAVYLFEKQNVEYTIDSKWIKDDEYENSVKKINMNIMSKPVVLINYTGGMLTLSPELTEEKFLAKLNLYLTFS